MFHDVGRQGLQHWGRWVGLIARQGTICQIEQGSSQVGRSSPLGSSLQKQTMTVLKHEAKSPRIGCRAKKCNLRLYTGLQSGNSTGSRAGSSKREGKITATAKARTAWEALKHDKTAGGKIKAWRHQNHQNRPNWLLLPEMQRWQWSSSIIFQKSFRPSL